MGLIEAAAADKMPSHPQGPAMVLPYKWLGAAALDAHRCHSSRT